MKKTYDQIYITLKKEELIQCGRGLSGHAGNCLRIAKILNPEEIVGRTLADWIYYNDCDMFIKYRGVGKKTLDEIKAVKANIIGLIQEKEKKLSQQIY